VRKTLIMSDPTRYSNYGQCETGFRSGIEHSMFGHWSNPEYSELLQMENYVPVSGTCQRCLEKFDDGFLANEDKNICIKCNTKIPCDYLPY
jgi:hypothetical protein